VALLYREQSAAGWMTRWVECAWRVEAREPLAGYPVRPDGCLDLLYSRQEGLRVVGAMTEQRSFDLAAGEQTVGVRLRPGMGGALLGAAPGELTDRILPAEDLWGGLARELEARLGEAEASTWMPNLLGALRRPADPGPVQRAIEAIVGSRGTVNLEWVARQANLSERQFRRRCMEESGLAPKHLCRILRFRHAWELAQGRERREWAGIAADAGYFDQAHLIRDFREFTGAPPMSVFSNPAARLPL
jgi:AraC-like DNA-binding protein